MSQSRTNYCRSENSKSMISLPYKVHTKYATCSHKKLYFVIPLSNKEKYAQEAFLKETELLDDVGTSECPPDQLPPKYPLLELGGAVEDLDVFSYLKKLPAAI